MGYYIKQYGYSQKIRIAEFGYFLSIAEPAHMGRLYSYRWCKTNLYNLIIFKRDFLKIGFNIG
ncbi:MAG: hypothetical protein IJ681_05005 [Bacteroidales bacterium]|nr:hypothetical protein [Bacteroidales bacterium]